MSFLLKQAINELVSNTSDIQNTLVEKAGASLTYTKTQVNDKILGLIDSAPASLDTLKELSLALTAIPTLEAPSFLVLQKGHPELVQHSLEPLPSRSSQV